jgi:hypothetical protein
LLAHAVGTFRVLALGLALAVLVLALGRALADAAEGWLDAPGS